MKYRYYYQTRENENREGVIAAKDRNDAYSQLRKQGIKPIKVVGRDPIRWKPWSAVVVLGAAVAVLAWLLAKEEKAPHELPRAQLYGDPAIIQQISADGWRKSFEDAGDAWLARHAIPASMCECRDNPPTNIVLATKPLAIAETDAPELAKMKRMVNGMKRELAEYLAGGGAAEDYMALCDERLAIERGHVAIYSKEFDKLRKARPQDIEAQWESKNEELRDMGLPTVIMPESDE